MSDDTTRDCHIDGCGEEALESCDLCLRPCCWAHSTGAGTRLEPRLVCNECLAVEDDLILQPGDVTRVGGELDDDDATRERVWSASFANLLGKYSGERAWELADVCAAAYATEKRRRREAAGPAPVPVLKTGNVDQFVEDFSGVKARLDEVGPSVDTSGGPPVDEASEEPAGPLEEVGLPAFGGDPELVREAKVLDGVLDALEPVLSPGYLADARGEIENLTADQAADLALCLEEVKGRFPGDVSDALRQARDVATDGCGRNYLDAEDDQLKHEEETS